MRLDPGVIDLLNLKFVRRDGPSTVAGNIRPNVTESYNLGSAGRRFDTIYARTVIADTFTGTVAGNADTVDGFHASSTPTANQLLALNGSSVFPTSVYASALLVDGSRALTGNLSVNVGVTVDGVDISVFKTSYDSHVANASNPHSVTFDQAITAGPNPVNLVTFSPTSARAPFALGANAQNQTVTGFRADSLNKSVNAGDGITGGGALTADRTFTLGTPSTLTVSTTNAVTTSSHTHAITTSSNPSGASILASDSSGQLRLQAIGINIASGTNNIVQKSSSDTAFNVVLERYSATGRAQIVLRDQAAQWVWRFGMTDGGSTTFNFYDTSQNVLSLEQMGSIILYPPSTLVLPGENYLINLGTISNKYLTLHAAELWVQNLIAQNTIATIGGRILVGPTDQFAVDLLSTTTETNVFGNPGFETAGAGGADVFANWTESAGDGSITQSTTKRSGTYSCLLIAGPLANTSVRQSEGIGIVAGERWAVRFWTRSWGGDVSLGRFRIWDVSNAAWILTETDVNNTAGTATWRETIYTFVVPAGCTNIRVDLLCPTVDTDRMYFDDVVFTQGVTVTTEYNQMVPDDIAYSEHSGKVEFFHVVSGPVANGTEWDYKVCRNLDATGENDWYAGDALFNTGSAGEGHIDLYSVSGVIPGSTEGPTIVGNVRKSAIYNDWSEHWAIGNLKGIYGYGSTIYGAAFGDYDDGAYLTVDPTYGIRMVDPFGVTVLSLPPAGNALLTGTLTVQNPGKVTADNGHIVLDDQAISLYREGHALKLYNPEDALYGSLFGWSISSYVSDILPSTRTNYFDITTGKGITSVTLSNPGFETGTLLPGWTVGVSAWGGSGAVTSTRAYSGTYSLYLYSGVDTFNECWAEGYSTRYTCAVGEMVTFGFWYYPDFLVYTGGHAEFFIEFYNSSVVLISSQSLGYINIISGISEKWKYQALRAIAPTNTATARIRVRVTAYLSLGEAGIYLDDFTMTRHDVDSSTIRMDKDNISFTGAATFSDLLTSSSGIANTGTIVTSDDVFIGGDEAGVKWRMDQFRTPDLHFDTDAVPSGFSWATSPFTTPATVDYVSYKSHIYMSHSSSGTRHFLFRSLESTSNYFASVALSGFSTTQAIGFRLDDGTDSYYVEYVLMPTGDQSWKCQMRWRNGAGVTTYDSTNQITAPIPIILNLTINGTRWSSWGAVGRLQTPFSRSSMWAPNSTAITGNTWTPTRMGLLYEQGSLTWASALCDFLDW